MRKWMWFLITLKWYEQIIQITWQGTGKCCPITPQLHISLTSLLELHSLLWLGRHFKSSNSCPHSLHLRRVHGIPLPPIFRHFLHLHAWRWEESTFTTLRHSIWRCIYFIKLTLWVDAHSVSKHISSFHADNFLVSQSASGIEDISYNFEEISSLTFSWGLTSVISSSTVSIVSPSSWDLS